MNELQDILKELSWKPCPRCGEEHWLSVYCKEEVFYNLSFYLDTHLLFLPEGGGDPVPAIAEERLNRFTMMSTDEYYFCGFCDLTVYDVVTKKWATDEEIKEEAIEINHVW